MAVFATPITTEPIAFESIYREAGGTASAVPWDRGGPHPALVTWLNAVAPSMIRCGARVAVVGCGLGHDARELMRRGYEVTAFDCSETAIQWARRLDPSHSDCYRTSDLFQPPARWRHRFDLVVEIHTIQALHPEMRLGAVSAIGDLVAPRGRLLVICRGAETPSPLDAGPPWPLTAAELLEATALAGLVTDGEVSTFLDSQDPPVLRMRAVFKRG